MARTNELDKRKRESDIDACSAERCRLARFTIRSEELMDLLVEKHANAEFISDCFVER